MATILSLIQKACKRAGLKSPSVVYTSTSVQTLQYAELANEEGETLARAHDWQQLSREQTFTTTATEAQSVAIPSDFDRFVNNSFWNRTTARPIQGPLTEAQYQMFAAFPVYTSMNPAFIVRNSSYRIQPAPAASQTVAYSYITKQWCESSGGTGQTNFTADADVPRLPDDLFILGLIWRFKQAKKFAYAEDFKKYEVQKAQYMGTAGGAPKLNLVYGLNRYSNWPFNVQEGSWT